MANSKIEGMNKNQESLEGLDVQSSLVTPDLDHCRGPTNNP